MKLPVLAAAFLSCAVTLGVFARGPKFEKNMPDIERVGSYGCEVTAVEYMDHKQPVTEKGIWFRTRFVLYDGDDKEVWSYIYSYRKRYHKGLRDCLTFYEKVYDKVEEWEKEQERRLNGKPAASKSATEGSSPSAPAKD